MFQRLPLIATLCLAAASIASAASVTISTSATIASGFDSANQFGGGNLAGQTFDFTFSYDTSLASFCLNGSDGCVDVGHLGFLTNTATVGSITVSNSSSVAYGDMSMLYSTSQGNPGTQVNLRTDYAGGGQLYVQFVVPSWTWTQGDFLSQSTMESMFSQAGIYGTAYASDETGNVYSILQLGDVTQSGGEAPEPATFLLGAAALGALYLKRRAA